MATMTKRPKKRSSGAEEEPPEREPEGEEARPPRILRKWKKGAGRKGTYPGAMISVEPDGVTLTCYLTQHADGVETVRLLREFICFVLENPSALDTVGAGEDLMWDL